MDIEPIIRNATKLDIPLLVPYLLNNRKQLFPMLGDIEVEDDIFNLEIVFIRNPNSSFKIALDRNGSIIGTIAFKKYNDRFSFFSFDKQKTNEIVKLYINKEYRRRGLATKLVNEIMKDSKKLNYENSYLHTHPFLPGATEFWLKNKFNIIHIENSHNLKTVHMNKRII